MIGLAGVLMGLVMVWAANGLNENGIGFTCTIGDANCQSCEFGVGGCNCSRADYQFWVETGFANFEASLEDCALITLGNLGQGGVLIPQVTRDCLADDKTTKNFATQCNTCFADYILCTMQDCLNDCSSSGLKDTPECRQCAIDFCEPNFIACSGWTTLKCDVCIVPEETIIPGMADEMFFGIVAGGGGLIIIVVAIVVWKVCLKKTDELNLNEVEAEGTDFQMPLSAVLEAKASEFDLSTPGGSSSSPQMRTGILGTPRQDSFGSYDSFDLDAFDEKPDI